MYEQEEVCQVYDKRCLEVSIIGSRRQSNPLREVLSYDGAQLGAVAGAVGGRRWFAACGLLGKLWVLKNKPFALYELRFHESRKQ